MKINTNGTATLQESDRDLDRTAAAALGAAHGWPFYLADLGRLRANIAGLQSALAATVAKREVGYSFKTNYLAAFIAEARACGVAAEVVSELEFDYALDLGYSGSEVVVNGPVKSPAFLARCLRAGAVVNVDSMEELRAVADLRPSGAAQVGIRVPAGVRGARSRFGIDTNDPATRAEVRRMLATRAVQIDGIHCHTAVARSAESFGTRLRTIAETFDSLRPGVRPDFLDVGGGMMSAVPEDIALQLSFPVETYADYAEALGRELHSFYGNDQPRLIVEPGMGLLADTMSLYAPVVSVKRGPSHTVAVVMASVLDVKPLRGAIEPSIRVVRADGGIDSESVEVTGNTCMEIDVLHNALEVTGPPLRAGDILEIRNVGAYSISLRPNFIEPAPAVLALGPEPEVLRPRMTAADFGHLYGRRT
ncbi:alanine racemase [Pseudonocardia acaciae]|uniref:alanine racemase n=1 Tax=Pseudonocardia acaciae TaxID=551276 RepID=UPI00048F5DF2|nr:alanine racemase [Pseudonocardia acaciae]